MHEWKIFLFFLSQSIFQTFSFLFSILNLNILLLNKPIMKNIVVRLLHNRHLQCVSRLRLRKRNVRNKCRSFRTTIACHHVESGSSVGILVKPQSDRQLKTKQNKKISCNLNFKTVLLALFSRQKKFSLQDPKFMDRWGCLVLWHVVSTPRYTWSGRSETASCQAQWGLIWSCHPVSIRRRATGKCAWNRWVS